MSQITVTNPISACIEHRNNEMSLSSHYEANVQREAFQESETTPLTIKDLVHLSIKCEEKINAVKRDNNNFEDSKSALLPFRLKQKNYWFQLCQTLLQDDYKVQDARNKISLLTSQIQDLLSEKTPHSNSRSPSPPPSSNSDTIKKPIRSLDIFMQLYKTKMINASIIPESITQIICSVADKDAPSIADVCSILMTLVDSGDYSTQRDYSNHLFSVVLSKFPKGHAIYQSFSFKLLRHICNWLRYQLKYKHYDNCLTVLRLFEMLNLGYIDLSDLSLLGVLNKITERSINLGQLAKTLLDNANLKQKALTDPVSKDALLLSSQSPELTLNIVNDSSDGDGEVPHAVDHKDDAIPDSQSKQEGQLSQHIVEQVPTYIQPAGVKSILRRSKTNDKTTVKKSVSFSANADYRYITPEYTLTEEEIRHIHNRKFDIHAREEGQTLHNLIEEIIGDFQWVCPRTINFEIADFARDDISVTRGGKIALIHPHSSSFNAHSKDLVTPRLSFDMASLINGVPEQSGETETPEDESVSVGSDDEILAMITDDDELKNYQKRKLEGDDGEDKANVLKRPKN